MNQVVRYVESQHDAVLVIPAERPDRGDGIERATAFPWLGNNCLPSGKDILFILPPESDDDPLVILLVPDGKLSE